MIQSGQREGCCRYTRMLLHIHIQQQHGLALLANMSFSKLGLSHTSLPPPSSSYDFTVILEPGPLYPIPTLTELLTYRFTFAFRPKHRRSSLQSWLGSYTQRDLNRPTPAASLPILHTRVPENFLLTLTTLPRGSSSGDQPLESPLIHVLTN